MTQAPIARRAPGDDPYAWLESRDAPEVLAHLEAENAYLEAELAPEAALREQLFEEIRARIRETDLSLPVPAATISTTSAPRPVTNTAVPIAAVAPPMAT